MFPEPAALIEILTPTGRHVRDRAETWGSRLPFLRSF